MLTLQNYVGNVQRNLCRSSLSSALLQMANLQSLLPERQQADHLRCPGESPVRATELKPGGQRVPVTATRHCLVPVLSRSAKTSFPEARTTSLRSVVLSRLGG